MRVLITGDGECMLSAHSRLSLYEAPYGAFTALRLLNPYVYLFLVGSFIGICYF